ncbi:hypothetical protein BD289DRAFT_184048 [Coniella lustricola]|uniref:Uncharacterized protein n=1 Tax=Coniella lustricola TaxID=2025994 RepID=A0A2T3ADB7_9PEZI|nr:hypothetical protein BD289DRAFT_184048 [Coniella lustricola]
MQRPKDGRTGGDSAWLVVGFRPSREPNKRLSLMCFAELTKPRLVTNSGAQEDKERPFDVCQTKQYDPRDVDALPRLRGLLNRGLAGGFSWSCCGRALPASLRSMDIRRARRMRGPQDVWCRDMLQYRMVAEVLLWLLDRIRVQICISGDIRQRKTRENPVLAGSLASKSGVVAVNERNVSRAQPSWL